MIHSLDVTVPLGEARSASDEAARSVLDDLTRGGTAAHFATDVDGRTLEATDIAWSFGSGPALRATATDLMLHLCGRSVPLDRLDGAPLPKIT